MTTAGWKGPRYAWTPERWDPESTLGVLKNVKEGEVWNHKVPYRVRLGRQLYTQFLAEVEAHNNRRWWAEIDPKRVLDMWIVLDPEVHLEVDSSSAIELGEKCYLQ